MKVQYIVLLKIMKGATIMTTIATMTMTITGLRDDEELSSSSKNTKANHKRQGKRGVEKELTVLSVVKS